MAITKNLGAIKKLSGGNIYVKKCTDAGGTVTSFAWMPLGYIQESTFAVETTIEEIKDETGDTVTSIETDSVTKLTGVLMQAEKEVFDFLTSQGTYSSTGAKGNYFWVVANRGTIDGKQQDVVGGICKIKPGFTDASGTRRTPFEITFLKVPSAITVSGLPTGTFGATSYVVPAGSTHLINEV